MLPACGQSAGVAPAPGVRQTQSVIKNSDGTITVTGTVASIKASNEFLLQAGTGCGYLNVYTSGSTTFSPSGAKPAAGSYVTATGTGSCSTSLNASSVTVSATSSVSPSPSPSLTVSGTIVAVKSAGEFEVRAGNCGYLNIFTSSTTSFTPAGVKPAVGQYAVSSGSGSCSTSLKASSVDLSTASTVSPAPSHIEVVVMENASYGEVIGNSAAPYINSMAQQHLLFTNSHAVTHPSEPNYLALFAGTTEGLSTDACPVTYSGSTLATELAAKGRTFTLFAEKLPSDNSTACSADADSAVASKYLYWRKHDPAADFPFIRSGETQPWTGSGTTAYGAADVSFIVPDICNDMHDCGVAAGDKWAAANIPAIESYNAAHNGLLIFTFDEADYDSTNHIVTIFDGLGLHGTSSQTVNHYNVLRYIETAFGLPCMNNSGSATPISL